MLLALSLFGESRAQFNGVHKIRPQHSVSFTFFGPGYFRIWYYPLRNGVVNEVYDSCSGGRWDGRRRVNTMFDDRSQMGVDSIFGSSVMTGIFLQKLEGPQHIDRYVPQSQASRSRISFRC